MVKGAAQIRVRSNHPPSYHWIEGHIRFQLGDAEGALPLLKQTIEMTPGFAPAFVTLAAVYSELGDQERSQSVLAAVLALEPGVSLDEFLELTPYALNERLFRLTQALGKVRAD